MSKHTPGPWRDIDGQEVHAGKAEDRLICQCHAGFYEERWANARLIAAAPAMLDALKRIADGQWPMNIAETEGTLAMREVARKAISMVELMETK